MPPMTVLPGGGAHDAREVMNMSPSTTTGDVSTTETVWNF